MSVQEVFFEVFGGYFLPPAAKMSIADRSVMHIDIASDMCY